MNEGIRQLLGLQECDLQLDQWKTELARIPKEIGQLMGEIDTHRKKLEEAKKQLTQLQVGRKEMEIELQIREEEIRKQSAALNILKSNEAYRAMLGEIEKTKQQKSVIEDEIIKLLDQIDQQQKEFKQREADFKKVEEDFNGRIRILEDQERTGREELQKGEARRAHLIAGYSEALVDRYEGIRKSRRSAAVVAVKGEYCSGCNMSLSPNVINEVKRDKELVACENCSRILYLPEPVAT